jgi:hypothetical protein
MSFSITEFLATTNLPLVEKLAVFPNPATHFLYLKNNAELKNLTIVDMLGNKVLSIENPTQTVDIQQLPVGTYIIYASENKKQLVAKFVKY